MHMQQQQQQQQARRDAAADTECWQMMEVSNIDWCDVGNAAYQLCAACERTAALLHTGCLQLLQAVWQRSKGRLYSSDDSPRHRYGKHKRQIKQHAQT
jgi:hypothetical protein